MRMTHTRAHATLLIAVCFLGGCTENQEAAPRGGESAAAMTGASTAAPATGVPDLPTFAVATDSGPRLVMSVVGDSVQLSMDADSGDQINALLPPLLSANDGRQLTLRGTTITSDSAYYVGPVTLTLPRTALPIVGTLRTSYCKKGEKLCRVVKRPINLSPPYAS